MMGRLVTAAVVAGLTIVGAASSASAQFSGRTTCIDTFNQGSTCQKCTATYDNNGAIMSEATVNVALANSGSSLPPCGGGYGTGMSAAASASGSVRVRSLDGSRGPVTLTIPVMVSLQYTQPHCAGYADVEVYNKHLHIGGKGEVSTKWSLSVEGGQSVTASAGGYITCGGCAGLDAQGLPYNCTSDGQVVADPQFQIDARWAHAGSFALEWRDFADGDTWKPVVLVPVDIDEDGYLQEDDCVDSDPTINPGMVDVPDDGIDQDCTGGDARDAAGVLDPGAACVDDEDCESGACVEGICCETRCGDGDPSDCQSCFGAETGATDGTCAPLAAGTVCRPAAHACDAVEACDGVDLQCMPDFLKQIGEVCRPSAGGDAACDPEERCVASYPIDGSFQSVCPADVVSSAPACIDGDGDGVADDEDVCPNVADPLQDDLDGDGAGDACDPAVVSDAATYASGAAIDVDWAGLGGDARDWITIARAGSPVGSFGAWFYTGGGATGAHTFGAPSSGTYVVRAFAEGGFALVAESAPFVVAGDDPMITTDALAYDDGDPIDVVFTGLSGSAGDWITLAPAGSPTTTFGAFTYVGGATSGAHVFVAPGAGTYVVRAFYAGGFDLLAESDAFTVSGSAPGIVAPEGPVGAAVPIEVTYVGSSFPTDWITVVPEGSSDFTVGPYVYTGAASSGTVVLPALGSGTYVARLFANNGYVKLAESAPFFVEGEGLSLTSSLESYPPGADVVVDFYGLDGAPNNWVAIAPQGGTNWSFVAWSYVPEVSGTRSFPHPAPGTYVARLYARGDYSLLLETDPFVVE